MKINENIVSCAGNFALRARCKWRGELRAYALVAIRGTDAVSICCKMAAYFYEVKIR